jgi:hypothetical protein
MRRRTLHFNIAVKENTFKAILKILINCKQPFTDNYNDCFPKLSSILEPLK